MTDPVPKSLPITRGEILMSLGGTPGAYGVTMIEGYKLFFKTLSADTEAVDRLTVMGELYPLQIVGASEPTQKDTQQDPDAQEEH